MQVLEIALQRRAVVRPWHTVGAASGFSARNDSRRRSMLTWWTSAVNRCVPSCLAASRTRASACDTRARLCVRCVLCCSAFPLAPSLHRRRSPGFVRRFLRYYGGVRLLPSVRHRLRPFGPSRCAPHLPQGRPNDRSPSSRAESFHACVGSTTSRGRAGCSPWRARPCGLPHCPTGPIVPQAPLSHRVGASNAYPFAAQYPARM